MPMEIEMEQLIYLLIPIVVIVVGIYFLFIHKRICSSCGRPVRPIWRQCTCTSEPSIVFSQGPEEEREGESTPATRPLSYDEMQPVMEEGIGTGTEVMLPSASSSAWLLIEEVGTPAKQHEIKGNTASIGTNEDNDVVLGDKAVSRHHAKIRLEGKKYFIFDLASTNGTRVNGRKVTKRWIKDGDRIEMGHTRMTFKPNALPGAEYKPSNLLKM
jgi:pSer/pThr/pTyr-binding forkhead associated (FHA) protein